MASLLDPKPAVRVVSKGDVSGSDNVPAILWLTLVLLALWSLRHNRLPTVPEAATAAVAIGAIVLVGSVVPRLAVWVLLALVVAGAIGGAPQIAAFIEQFASKGVTLSLNPGAQPNG